MSRSSRMATGCLRYFVYGFLRPLNLVKSYSFLLVVFPQRRFQYSWDSLFVALRAERILTAQDGAASPSFRGIQRPTNPMGRRSALAHPASCFLPRRTRRAQRGRQPQPRRGLPQKTQRSQKEGRRVFLCILVFFVALPKKVARVAKILIVSSTKVVSKVAGSWPLAALHVFLCAHRVLCG